MRITDIRCARIGASPVVRVVTDEGIDGFAEVEYTKANVVSTLGIPRELLIGHDPTEVERCMIRIRRLGGSKPWGAMISAIEIALWDIAGKAAELPIHRLLGGKVRDRIRVYNGGVRRPLEGHTPHHYADSMAYSAAAPEGFSIFKEGVGLHGFMAPNTPDFLYNELRTGPLHPNRGPMTPNALAHIVDCVAAMKDVLGPDRRLALDMGPGWTVSDAITVLRRLEPFDIAWAEDLLTGDFVPWGEVDGYREITRSTIIPTHTGEQIYLRQNFRELIDRRAVRVIGPDPGDVGGLAELKWIAEFADLYGIQIAPHGVSSGLLGLAALIQVGAVLPDNLIAFEYPVARDPWWYQMVTGLGDPIVVNGHVTVGDAPGLGIELDRELATAHLEPGAEDFFEWNTVSAR
ncbi:mandelate racemase/muconate lactonizing enzyme family protein [Streptomyces niveus]|uniref:Mandelate racemase n=1 Tax=Streptomyces niveus TaxID=193462 RepID=A0A1U9QL96_STRNV|nr:mandelate racemase/muconate lactonizing enzyme family protein [Streptomyces niveus]AQU65048.1 mandelate racemase [Streptomyces niveus]